MLTAYKIGLQRQIESIKPNCHRIDRKLTGWLIAGWQLKRLSCALMCGRDRRVVVMEMLRCRRLLTDWQVSLLAEHSHLVVPRHIQKRRRQTTHLLDCCHCDWAGSPNSRSILHTATLLLGYTLLSPYNIHPSSSEERRVAGSQHKMPNGAGAFHQHPHPPLSILPNKMCLVCLYVCCIFFSYQLNRTEINKISCVIWWVKFLFLFLFGRIILYTYKYLMTAYKSVDTHVPTLSLFI